MRILAVLAAALITLAGTEAAAQAVNPLAPRVTTEQPDSPLPSTLDASAPPATGPASLTATDVNAWLDGYLPYALAAGDIPGAVVVVVRDGQVLAERGYGFADVAKRTPVDPRRTLFRPGSVSKLLTWTAVMQQVEKGKLDLDADVNRYLDFRIPPYRGRPITLRNIMTHTAGFEETAKSLIGYDEMPGYVALLKRWTPKRVYAPGTTPAYSNYATSLAGYIVERVSGQPFDAYVRQHILAPIGMTRSTFEQPVPAALRPALATGHRQASEPPVPYEFVGPGPAGALSATGADMGRFMIAHLNGGAGLLQPQTARLMHTTTLPVLPHLDRMALGFYQSGVNGRRVIAHAGDTVGFHSDLHLFLDDRVGLYISMNGGGREGAAGSLRTALFESFADRYFPAPPDTRRVPKAEAAEHARQLAGTYSNSRGAHSNFLHALQLIGQVKVGADDQGGPVVPLALGLNGKPRRWVEVAPYLWHDLNSHERMAAKVVDGKVVRFSLDSLPFMMFDPVPWWKNSALVTPLLLASLAILALTALLWPVRALVRRSYGARFALEGEAARAHRLSRLAALLIVLTITAWAVTITMMMEDLELLGGAMDPVIRVLQIASFLILPGGLLVLAWNVWATWRGGRRWPAKAWSILLLLAAGVVVWVAVAFNLLRFGVNY